MTLGTLFYGTKSGLPGTNGKLWRLDAAGGLEGLHETVLAAAAQSDQKGCFISRLPWFTLARRIGVRRTVVAGLTPTTVRPAMPYSLRLGRLRSGIPCLQLRETWAPALALTAKNIHAALLTAASALLSCGAPSDLREGLAVSADGLHPACLESGFFVLPALLQPVLKMASRGTCRVRCVRGTRAVPRHSSRHL